MGMFLLPLYLHCISTISVKRSIGHFVIVGFELVVTLKREYFLSMYTCNECAIVYKARNIYQKVIRLRQKYYA